MIPRVAAGTLAVCTVGLLTSCTSSTAGSPVSASPESTTSGPASTNRTSAALPARIRSFDTASLNPCTLLSASQQSALNIDRPVRGPQQDNPVEGSTLCTFIESQPTTGYGVAVDASGNAQSLLGSPDLVRVDQVDDVGVVVIARSGAGCAYALDVSDAARVIVTSTSGTPSQEVDCPKAAVVAASVIETLKELQPS